MKKIDNTRIFPMLFVINKKLEILWLKTVDNQAFIWGNSDDYQSIPMVIFKAILNVKHTYKKV